MTSTRHDDTIRSPTLIYNQAARQRLMSELLSVRVDKEDSARKFLLSTNWDAGNSLIREFTETAIMYGMMIISEKYLPPEKKTIAPVDVGGVAGGLKFIIKNILFKVSQDTVIVKEPKVTSSRLYDFPSVHLISMMDRENRLSMKMSRSCLICCTDLDVWWSVTISRSHCGQKSREKRVERFRSTLQHVHYRFTFSHDGHHRL